MMSLYHDNLPLDDFVACPDFAVPPPSSPKLNQRYGPGSSSSANLDLKLHSAPTSSNRAELQAGLPTLQSLCSLDRSSFGSDPVRPIHRTFIRRGGKLRLYGRMQPQERSLMIPEYLSQRATPDQLDSLIAAYLAQQQAEEKVQSSDSDADVQELQRIMLEVWRDRAIFELRLLDMALQLPS